MSLPLGIPSKFAQTYSLTSRAFWLKKPCCARMSKGSKPPEKLVFDFYSLNFFSNRQMGYQKIAQPKPKTGVQNKFKKIIWGKSYMQIKVFGSMRVPLRFFENLQTYSLTSRAFWLKKPCCARMSKGSKTPRKISFRLLLPQKKFK